MNAAVRRIAAPRPLSGEMAGPKPLNWSRGLKLAGSIGLIAVGGYAVLANTTAITTSNAVVSAYGVTLRTPIEGGLSGSRLHVGQTVAAGQVLASVHNGLVDARTLADFEAQLQRARANGQALEVQIAALEAMQHRLAARSTAFISATMARLEGSADEARSTLAAAVLRRDLAAATLQRRQRLNSTGYTSAADLDKAQSEYDIAARDADARRGGVKVVDAKLAAARQGIVADDNASDTSYSQQRVDEIAIKLVGLRRERTTSEAEVAQAAINVAREKARVEGLASSALVSPLTGIIWKLNASEGEHIGAGENVAQIVDCKAAFIMASVPQDRVPEIEIGSEVEYRLSGDGEKRFGRVVSVVGDESDAERNLVAAPFVTRGAPAAIIRIAIDTSGPQCALGRTARVVIASSGSGLSRFFNPLR